MEPATTIDFASAARTIARHARRRRLVAPAYRCPPRLVGVDRTIRRRPDGVVVSVRVKGRPRAAVLADMIEGVIVANGLAPPDADRVRADLWAGLAELTRPGRIDRLDRRPSGRTTDPGRAA
jgi:DNA-binding LacI/PurR family transcriptional regulator